MSNIPFVDLAAQYQLLKPEIDARIQSVLDHGRFINGPEITELESALCEFSGCEHAVGVASGTDALVMALMAAGVGPGDAVFLPSFTFTASAEVVLVVGAQPVFVDVDPRSFNIDLDHLRTQIDATKKAGKLNAKAIVPVDLFGLPASYTGVNEIAKEHDLFVLADAAQSFGARLGEARVGTLAPVTTTSFFPAKPLGCYGDGGAIFTNNAETASILRSIRAHGKGTGKYDIVRVGVNGRLDTLQAAILLPKLAIFDREIAARETLAAHYDARLSQSVTTPLREDRKASSWAQYSVLLDNRDDVAAKLGSAGIPTAIYYPLPMHLQPAYAMYGDGKGSLPVSESLAKRILSLPMHPYMEDATADKICDALIEAVR